MEPAIPLTWNEALSGIFGSISLAAWVFLIVPQLVENYRVGSADGISFAFILIWLAGDITNVLGATWAKLVPTVIALAIYFCIADTALIGQCVYYNLINSRRRTRSQDRTQTTESDPLLAENTQRRPPRRQSSIVGANPRSELEHQESWTRNLLSIVLVCVVGTAGWAMAWRSGVWAPIPEGDVRGSEDMPLGAVILGYISAVCYLGARIPQIIKNQRERSVEGLSLLFFLLSMIGNATYGAGILFHSVEKTYVLKNLPWLLGSIGTMAEDAIIFGQFRTFRQLQVVETVVEEDEEDSV